MGLGEEFADAVIDFSIGARWDDDDDVRLVALTGAGGLARVGARRAELMAMLLRTVRDEVERPVVREAAYSAILRALGTEWSDVPGAGRVDDLGGLIDLSVLDRAEQLARRGG